jgi:Spy/CpxP family protein refolding chaperone
MVLRVFLALMLATGLASAQGKKGGGGGGMGGESPAMRPQRLNKLDTIAEKLKLNKDQKDAASKIFDAAQQEAAPLRDQFDQGRKAITGALIAGKTDDVNKMMEQYSELLAQQAMVEAKAYSKLYALLEPKQQAKAPQVYATEMAGMFSGRNWRGGGGGGGFGGRGEGR